MPRPDFLIGDEPARLIPVTPDSARELKSVSVILAGLRSVLELRQSLLKSLGVRVGTNATLEAWIEPVFQNEDKKAVKNKDRPDGLLILRTGRREWRALIEAKVGNDTIGEEQVSRYLQPVCSTADSPPRKTPEERHQIRRPLSLVMGLHPNPVPAPAQERWC